jgi:membrane protein required for colicin V production
MDALPPPSLVDVIAIVVLVVGGVQGALRGLSGELARLISVIIAFMLGLRFYQPFGAWVLEHTRLGGRPSLALAFVVTVVTVIVVLLVLRHVIKRVMKIVVEEQAEKSGGALAGVIESTIYVLIAFVVLNLVPHDYLNRKFGEESIVGTCVQASMPHLQEIIEDIGGYVMPDREE